MHRMRDDDTGPGFRTVDVNPYVGVRHALFDIIMIPWQTGVA